MSDIEQLQRLRVAAISGYLSADLARWAVAIVEQQVLPAAARRADRDELLREAAVRVEGSLWRKSCEVRDIIEAFRKNPGLAKAGVMPADSPAEYVQRAWRIDHNLPRHRHLLTILSN